LLRKPLIDGADSFEVREFANQIGVGESEYTKYDRIVCDAACAWMRTQGRDQSKPWVMFTSFISPHYPLIAPREFFDLYDDDAISMPYKMNKVSDHPVVREMQQFFNYADHIDENLTRTGRRAYFALCSFLDYLVGKLLNELEQQGLADDTRIIFTSDHGEMLGNHGLWTKMVMNEDSIAIPMIVTGEGVPAGKVVDTPVSLVDCYQSAVECVGEELTNEELKLPGTSLYRIADGENADRCVISEYHDGGVSTGMFAIRKGQWKYNYYPGHAPQLYDLSVDPQEDSDLAAIPNYEGVLDECDTALRDICDPDAVEKWVHEKQGAIIEELGGYDVVASLSGPDLFIEYEALYVNDEALRAPPDVIVQSP
jgi:choline-sulfatase